MPVKVQIAGPCPWKIMTLAYVDCFAQILGSGFLPWVWSWVFEVGFELWSQPYSCVSLGGQSTSLGLTETA
jgi:hypothetical protein